MPPLSTVDALIDRYQLQPHPECGWYRELHRSPLAVQRADGEGRSALTLILFLLPGGAVSRWHRVAAADESWHVIGGEPLELLQLPPEGGTPECCRLGFALEDPSLLPVTVVPAGCWQAARSLGAWSLVSCCVGPGFSFVDFSLLAECPGAPQPPAPLAALL